MQHQAHAAGAGLFFGLEHGFLENALFFVPAFGIEAGEFRGQFHGPLARGSEHEFKGGFAGSQASGRVDARGQGKDDLAGAKSGRGRKIAGRLEGGYAHALAFGDFEQAVFDQNPVLAAKFHHIGQGAQSHQIKQGAHVGLGPAGGVQFVVGGGHEQKSHAHPGQAGAGTGREAGVDQSVGFGHFLGRQVVVGDNDGHAQGFGVGHGFHVRNAAIHGKQYAHAFGGQAVEHVVVQAVAFVQAVGNMVAGLKAVPGEKVQNQGRGGYAVHIVVAPHAQAFALKQGPGKH